MLLKNDLVNPEYFDARGKEIKGVLSPSTATSAVNRGYVVDAITASENATQTKLDLKVDKSTPINQLTTATAALSLGNQKITGLAPATLPSDAVRFD